MELTIKQYAQKHKMSQFDVIKLINTNKLDLVERDGEKYVIESNSNHKEEKLIDSNFCTISAIVDGGMFVSFANLHVQENGEFKISCPEAKKIIGINAILCIFENNEKYKLEGQLDQNMRFCVKAI